MSLVNKKLEDREMKRQREEDTETKMRAQNVLRLENADELNPNRPLEDLPWCLLGAGGPREEFYRAEEFFLDPDNKDMSPKQAWESVKESLEMSLAVTTDYICLLKAKVEQLEKEKNELRSVISKRVLPYDID